MIKIILNPSDKICDNADCKSTGVATMFVNVNGCNALELCNNCFKELVDKLKQAGI